MYKKLKEKVKNLIQKDSKKDKQKKLLVKMQEKLANNKNSKTEIMILEKLIEKLEKRIKA